MLETTNTQMIAPTSPTRFSYNSASIIDFALTRNLPWPSQVESIAELSSDHNPIMINLDTKHPFRFSEAKRNDGLGALSRTPKLRPLHLPANHRAHGGRRRKTICRPLHKNLRCTHTLFETC
ncbi:hypothetical protein TNCV_3447231 [Trichonephila clavipes]|nr:hypothetical protein TNCV_3447231 [Trichonephila clavipes]